jgi:nitrogen fixation-related uncharacterized protein
MASVSAWEAIFMLVALKIPMVYLAVVVWWAIKAEPLPDDGQEPVRALVPLTPCGWSEWRRKRPSRVPVWRPAGPRGRRTSRSRMRVPA